MSEAWAPTLADVARHIPTRTRDRSRPGSDSLLGTFTADTTPTDVQAQAVIDDAVAGVLAACGKPPPSPPADAGIGASFRAAAEWRAAADIELAYPNRDADVAVYAMLDARAKAALATAQLAVETGDDSPPAAAPVWYAPPPERPLGWGPFGWPSRAGDEFIGVT